MRLPNGDRAIIDERKIRDYSLSPDHEDGQHKARLFETTLGLTIDDADRLIAALRRAAASDQAIEGKQDKHGQRYVVDFEFSGPSGSATVRSAWIVRTNDTVPRLVTCYIL